MATFFQWFWGLSFSLSVYYVRFACTENVHIVYLGLTHAHDHLLTTKSHIQLLSRVFANEDDANKAMLYSYMHTFSGFAAKLNSTQANMLAMMEGVISVFKSKTLTLHTTRSWDFMGLTLDHGKVTPLQLAYGDDVVVGVFDTGIWPELQSFREEVNMGPIPQRWKGKCVKGQRFEPSKACNKKLIGARYYIKGFEEQYGPINSSGMTEFRSPRDHIGHGTHTASTAVGSIVRDGSSSFYGFGSGTARGGAPRARLAVYKVCWSTGFQASCTEADLLAAYDDALYDGVDVISASLGLTPPLHPFYTTASDIGSFHASQLGISVVFSAGNDGPDLSLVQNVAPWATCVAASTIDRTFPTEIFLGNQLSIMGQGFIVQEIKEEIAFSRSYFKDGICQFENRNGKAAMGKVILCFSSIGPQSSEKASLAVYSINGSAMIFATTSTRQIAQVDSIPTVYVDINQGAQILNYIIFQSPHLYLTLKGVDLQRPPMVQIFQSKTIIGQSPAPSIAYFSSRGPSSLYPNILKPDITAPGVNILAAWPPETPPAIFSIDTRSVNWNFDTGTSMSCPHVSGIVALLKSAHQDWSPSAIKSAIMTTAYTRDTSSDDILAGGSVKSADSFDIGAGHIDPLKAMDPGLVYDMDSRDYILFLCSIGYTPQQIKIMLLPSSGTEICCPKEEQLDLNLNYPAIVVSNLHCKVTIKRTLSNVGHSCAVYFVRVNSPQGVLVHVWPRMMVFWKKKEKISYYVTLTPLKQSEERYDFGEIVWSDGYHYVRSPLVVRVNNTDYVNHITSY